MSAVPRFAPSRGGPVLEFERKMLDAMPAIERWFRMQWQDHTPPFYGSVERLCPDARNVLLIPERHTRNQFYLTNAPAAAVAAG